jgi:hypothetical protein
MAKGRTTGRLIQSHCLESLAAGVGEYSLGTLIEATNEIGWNFS